MNRIPHDSPPPAAKYYLPPSPVRGCAGAARPEEAGDHPPHPPVRGPGAEAVLYCTVLYCTVLYCTLLYCTVLCCTVLHCTVLYCTVLYCTVLYFTVLYCTAPGTPWRRWV